jgi:hypothetical protein
MQSETIDPEPPMSENSAKNPPGEVKKLSLRVVHDEKSLMRCQVHGEPIRVDCQLSECVFHTRYPGVKNCVLVYMAKQGLHDLKAIDIGMLKGIPAQKVNRDLSRATVAMRNDTLKVSNAIDVEPRFVTMVGLDVCYACETPITMKNRKAALETRLPRSGDTVTYCSQACHDQKPPQFIAAEIACCNDIAVISEWASKKYSTLGGLEQALGMNRALLGEALKNLLDIDAEELYSTTQRVKTRSKELVRRTGSRPEWLSNFMDLMRPLLDDMTRKHGKPKMNFSALVEEVQTVIDTI